MNIQREKPAFCRIRELKYTRIGCEVFLQSTEGTSFVQVGS
jgi:hypothetical protein